MMYGSRNQLVSIKNTNSTINTICGASYTFYFQYGVFFSTHYKFNNTFKAVQIQFVKLKRKILSLGKLWITKIHHGIVNNLSFFTYLLSKTKCLQVYSSVPSTFSVPNFLNVGTFTQVTKVYNLCGESSSSFRLLANCTRIRNGTLLKTKNIKVTNQLCIKGC